MKYTQPLGKVARRLGIALSPKTAKVIEKRPTVPGQHGPTSRGNQSVYATQLREKQKLRFQFMITDKVLKRTFKEALRLKGDTGTNLIRLLDERLDATLVRSGVVPTFLAARQVVNHRHVFVNGKRVTIAGYMVKVGDVITLSDTGRNMPHVLDGLKRGATVPYVDLDKASCTIRRMGEPERIDIPVICDEHHIVEWYSR